MNTEKTNDDGTVTTDSGIVRSNRMFVQLASVGEVDNKGKTVFAARGFEKVIAEVNKPITTCILPLLAMLMNRSHVDDPALMQSELDALKRWVAALHINTPGEKEEQPCK